MPSTFKVGLLAQATIAAVACAQVLLEELQRKGDATSLVGRLGKRRVEVDQREAVLEFASERYTSEYSRALSRSPQHGDELTQSASLRNRPL